MSDVRYAAYETLEQYTFSLVQGSAHPAHLGPAAGRCRGIHAASAADHLLAGGNGVAGGQGIGLTGLAAVLM